ARYCDTTTCVYDTIAISLSGVYGVDPTTIRLWVDGVLYTYGSPCLEYRGGRLYWIPPDTNWFMRNEGRAIPIWLERADDYLGNPLDTLHQTRWNLLIDHNPPHVYNVSPPNNDTIINYPHEHHWQDTVSFEIADSFLSVNMRTLTVTVDSFYTSDTNATPGRVSYTLHCGDPGLICDGSNVLLDPRMIRGIRYFEDTLSGAYFTEFDWITVRVIAEDIPPCNDGCGPNVGITTWRFYIADDDTTPPIFSQFYPSFIGEFNDINLRITIHDTSGIYDELGGVGS
ncbi:MAG: hypothetical protein ACPL6C_03695, partial [bacterium]